MTPQQQTLSAEIEEAVFAVISAHRQQLPAAPSQELIDYPNPLKVNGKSGGSNPKDGKNGVIGACWAYPAVIAKIAAGKYFPYGLYWSKDGQFARITPLNLKNVVEAYCKMKGVKVNCIPKDSTLSVIIGDMRRVPGRSNPIQVTRRGGYLYIPETQIDEALIPECLR